MAMHTTKTALPPFSNNFKTKRETVLHALYEYTDKYKIWKNFLQIIKDVKELSWMPHRIICF